MGYAFNTTLKILTLLAMLSFVSSKKANADIELFPEQPIYRTIMVDPDIPRTEIKVPQGLEKELLEKPIGELLPYVSLGKTLPLISLDISAQKYPRIIPIKRIEDEELKAFAKGQTLSKKIISTSLVASGQLNFPQNQENDIHYKTKLELFFNSPMIDDYLSNGNKFYLVAGLTGQGSTKSNTLPNKTLSQIAESFIDNYSFSADAYIVPKSPYSDQYLILRVGVDNLFGNVSEKPNVHISTTWEFPPLFHFSPYVSIHIQMPTDSEKPITVSGQGGIKASAKSKKALFLYAQADYNEQNPWKFHTGLKLEL